jgi:hypothetical protein
MNFLTFFILFLCIFKTAISANLFNPRFRNTVLRIYISNDEKNIISEYKNKIENTILSKYSAINLFYDNLLKEEKELIEAIMLLIV